jgi:hypothetical protein
MPVEVCARYMPFAMPCASKTVFAGINNVRENWVRTEIPNFAMTIDNPNVSKLHVITVYCTVL